MKTVYLAHPYSAPTEQGMLQNLQSAKDWYKWCCDNYWPTFAFNAMWIVNVEVFNDADHKQRRRGMERNNAHIFCCDELWLLGSHVSPGMREEAQYARDVGLPVFDLTDIGDVSSAPRVGIGNMLEY